MKNIYHFFLTMITLENAIQTFALEALNTCAHHVLQKCLVTFNSQYSIIPQKTEIFNLKLFSRVYKNRNCTSLTIMNIIISESHQKNMGVPLQYHPHLYYVS